MSIRNPGSKNESPQKIHFELKKLKNLASDINMLRGASDQTAEAIEYDVDRVGFEVDERSCRQGQLVEIEGIVHNGNNVDDFTGTGKIVEVTKIGNGRVKVVVELHSYNKKVWQRFVLALQQMKSQSEKLFSSIKGEE